MDKDQSGICDNDEVNSEYVSEALKECIRVNTTEDDFEDIADWKCGHLLRHGCEFDFDAPDYILAIICK
ncbi:MAG: hypothetical protein ABIH55_01815 [Nanoarchaeota archaeon]